MIKKLPQNEKEEKKQKKKKRKLPLMKLYLQGNFQPGLKLQHPVPHP